MTSIKDKIDENRAHAAPEKGQRSPAGSSYGDEKKPRVDEAGDKTEDDGSKADDITPERSPAGHE